MVEKHGKIEHALNERDRIMWDATAIRPEVEQAFEKLREQIHADNHEIAVELGHDVELIENQSE